VAPYLFGTLQLPPFSFDTFPTQVFSASDLDLTPPGFVTLNPGDVFGLAHVSYTVAPGAPGGDVAVSLVPEGPSLSDNNGDAIPSTPQNGTIPLPHSQAVPEPPALVLASLGAFLIAVARRVVRSRRLDLPVM